LKLRRFAKEARYADLMTEITERKWTPTLLTFEIGARGLVGSRTFRSFVTLGFSTQSANQLCKSLSDIVSRCSYAIYLAHSTVVWPHNNDLVVCRGLTKPSDETVICANKPAQKALVPNIVTLRQNGIKKLYHFTDASNIQSIRQHGLMSASNLIENSVACKMNSDDLSLARRVSEPAELCPPVLLFQQPNDACGL
jgi:hypothetical protein